MRIVVFGLAVSSSWGNGHAALWRGLIRALHEAGHHVTFFERDVPYYAEHRDLTALPGGGKLVLYPEWDAAAARNEIAQSDVAMITSYCPDAAQASPLVLESGRVLRCFYDLDTPVTLANLQAGRPVSYVGPNGFRGFDLVLSYTGGKALDLLRSRLGAGRVAPLFGWVDPAQYQPGRPAPQYHADLSYLGTYAPDRQAVLERLFVEPARRLPDCRFVIGGAMYPFDFPWTGNIWFVRHLPPPEHPAFYASSRLTLNVTRAAMAELGWCPSGRLFEAAACGVPILSDTWEGLDYFFTPGQEIVLASSTEDALAALQQPEDALRRIAVRARERALDQHTAAHRARDLIAALESASTKETA
ncbi:MAG TPA: glycosyltransferase [Rhodopila sp.]|nr:glycosyltransferase [Rhodopila sp.]